MTEKINVEDVNPIDDPCGTLREVHSSENLSIAHVIVTEDAKPHLHKKTEEVYIVSKGKGKLVLGDKELDIGEKDVIPIPKNVVHYLKKIPDQPLELWVVTYPKYDPDDMIFP